MKRGIRTSTFAVTLWAIGLTMTIAALLVPWGEVALDPARPASAPFSDSEYIEFYAAGMLESDGATYFDRGLDGLNGITELRIGGALLAVGLAGSMLTGLAHLVLRRRGPRAHRNVGGALTLHGALALIAVIVLADGLSQFMVHFGNVVGAAGPTRDEIGGLLGALGAVALIGAGVRLLAENRGARIEKAPSTERSPEAWSTEVH